MRAVSLNAKVEKTGMVDPDQLATSFNTSIRSAKAWSDGYTGKGVGVAVIDTGIAGDLPDFQVSRDRHHLAGDRLRGRQPGGDDRRGRLRPRHPHRRADRRQRRPTGPPATRCAASTPAWRPTPT